MAPISGIYLALATACLLLCNVAVAQESSTTEKVPSSTTVVPALPLPVDCESAVLTKINVTLLLGTWYQAARKPIGSSNNDKQCYQMIAEEKSGNVTVHVTYSTDLENLFNNQTKSIEVEVGTEHSEIREPIFNYTENGNIYTYKILETDFENYAYACAYLAVNAATPTTTTVAEPSSTTVSSPTSTPTSTVAGSSTTVASSTNSPVTTTTKPPSAVSAGAFILTRKVEVSGPLLYELLMDAFSKYTDFLKADTVKQSDECRYNGAASTVPALAMIMVAVYSLLKVFH